MIIRSITFQEDGSVALEYVEPADDIKSNGVVLNHVCFVPATPQYDSEIEVLVAASLALLEEALDDANRLGPPDPGSVPAEEDDELDICPPCRHMRCENCMGCDHHKR